MITTDPANALGELIPGYVALDDRARRLARLAHARNVHDQLHRHLLTLAATAGVPVSAHEREELTAPAYRITRVAHWDCPIPLVLIDIYYPPYGFTKIPEDPGSVTIWLRPTSEVAYLHSLADLWSFLTPLTSSVELDELHQSATMALAWLRNEVPAAA
jgi:hypothetical protein